ncbi:MAG: hypothetical protein OXC59_01490 [Acidimicrobiaceae bacterium]|nr:hypothetical protein [Acidimicrobiaceae bacterium]
MAAVPLESRSLSALTAVALQAEAAMAAVPLESRSLSALTAVALQAEAAVAAVRQESHSLSALSVQLSETRARGCRRFPPESHSLSARGSAS